MNRADQSIGSGMGRLKSLDIFVLVNLFLLLVMIIVVYYERFQNFRGPGNIHEFLVYAVLLIAIILAMWKWFRKLDFSNAILILLQIGILAHFAGAYVPVNDQRLYDAVFLGIGYDKYVHFYNAFAVAATINQIFQRLDVRIPMVYGLVLLFLVLGLGAIVEIVEYLVVLTIPDNGVGDYHNNMRDMIANLFGGSLFVLTRPFWQRILA